MALETTTKMANRLGLDLKFYEYTDDGTMGETPLLTLDFANEVSIDLDGDVTWATGGQTHGKMIGFKDPIEGTIKISTQVLNESLLALASGETVTPENKTITFRNDSSVVAPKYYIITGETLFVGENGVHYAETITAYKAIVKVGYHAKYTGEGDPSSWDIEFDLGTNGAGKVLDITLSDPDAPAPPAGGGGSGS